MLPLSKYQIYAVGKVRKKWIQDGIASYLKRLPGLTIHEVKDSTPQKEGKVIQSLLKKNELLIVLTEEGDPISSVPFSKQLQVFGSQRISFAIGGAEGIDNQLKKSATILLSLSRMTFPHEIALLLLVEQIYRAQTISQASPYHREGEG